MPNWLKNVLWTFLVLVFIAATLLAFLWATKQIEIDSKLGYSLWAVCVTGVIAMVLRALGSRTEKTFSSEKDEKILPYLEAYIKSADELTIFSTSFSWVNEEMKQAIKEKLQNNQEVLFFIPQLNDAVRKIADELKGLEVREYKDKPHVRFTLLNRNTSSHAKLRVGQPVDSKFKITDFTSQRDGELISTMTLLVEIAKQSIPKYEPAS